MLSMGPRPPRQHGLAAPRRPLGAMCQRPSSRRVAGPLPTTVQSGGQASATLNGALRSGWSKHANQREAASRKDIAYT
jgi:hypothetical protein